MEIRTLCDKKIMAFAGANKIPVSYENVKFKNTDKYLETFILPAANEVATFHKEQESGIYQINVYMPTNQGAEKTDALVKSIMNLFKTGTKTGDFIHLPATSRSQGFKTDTHYCVSISVNYMRIK